MAAVVVTGGVIGWDSEGRLARILWRRSVGPDNISAILAEAGACPEHLVRLTWYVVDIEEYLANLKALGRIYREIFGAHYPAMALVQVVRLVEVAARRDRGNGGGAALNVVFDLTGAMMPRPLRRPTRRCGSRPDWHHCPSGIIALISASIPVRRWRRWVQAREVRDG